MADQPQSLNEERLQRLAQKLDEQTAWPAEYLFKFIVPLAELAEVQELFVNTALTQRESRTGKYMSVSATQTVSSSAQVVAVYRQAALIPGLLAL